MAAPSRRVQVVDGVVSGTSALRRPAPISPPRKVGRFSIIEQKIIDNTSTPPGRVSRSRAATAAARRNASRGANAGFSKLPSATGSAAAGSRTWPRPPRQRRVGRFIVITSEIENATAQGRGSTPQQSDTVRAVHPLQEIIDRIDKDKKDRDDKLQFAQASPQYQPAPSCRSPHRGRNTASKTTPLARSKSFGGDKRSGASAQSAGRPNSADSKPKVRRSSSRVVGRFTVIETVLVDTPG